MNSMEIRTIPEWMAERRIDFRTLLERTALDPKTLEAMLHGRYTPSPVQRQRVSAALGVEAEQIFWGHLTQVDHIQGHGPQFGRSP